MNPLETDDQGRYLCHWCKQPVPYAALGIRVIWQIDKFIRIGTCYEHSETEPVDSAR